MSETDPKSKGTPAASDSSGPNSASGASANPNAESGGSRSGSASDSLLGRLVIERGLATQAEIDAAFSALRAATNPTRTFVDVLVDGQVVTRRQLARIRAESESDKSVLRIPGYQMIRKLGAGAMASVYLAKQLSLDRLVAVKILPHRYSTDATFIERFYKEGKAAAKLSDPNIVGAFDVGQVGDQHYFVMEYVDGETVYDRIVRFKRLKDRDALTITRQVASALKHAHAAGFIHRDIKPKNIMITKANLVKLADLGLARAMSDKKSAEAERHQAFGTPYYISPEQIRGAIDLGPPADIYGLGATLYHMLTGRVPFEGRTPKDVMQSHLRKELTPPDQVVSGIGEGSAEIVEMMMKKSPRDRYQSADELLEDIDLALAGQPLRYASRRIDVVDIASDVEGSAESEIQSPTKGAPFSGLAMALIAGLAALCGVLVLTLILLHVLKK